MPFQIVTGDLTRFKADALVNAANARLQEGGGVCGALFQAAGRSQLKAACDQIGGCDTGQAVITPAFNLPAQYLIHAVGPVYLDGNQGEEALLRSAYQSALRLAEAHGLSSIAFPMISSGIYGYPWQEAFQVARDSIRDYLNQQQGEELDVTLVLYDKRRSRLDPPLKQRLDQLLLQAEVDEARLLIQQAEYDRNRRHLDSLAAEFSRSLAEAPQILPDMALPTQAREGLTEPAARALQGLDALLEQVDEGFSTTLLRLIDIKGLPDAQVYKRANLDRKHFSKIRSKPNYTPGKRTVLALCIALELNRQQTEDLLARAGYALSPSHKQDLIVGYFIDEGIYQIDTINLALYDYDQQLLGSF